MEKGGQMAMILSLRDKGRFRLGGGAMALLALGLLLVLSAWMTAPAKAAIPFERCQEAGAEDWECAKHTVPLDWTGKVPGTIDLEVRRYRPPGSPDPSAKLPFVALAGGPGQGATISADDYFARGYAPAIADYQLIVYDQRGTGLSGPLYCPALREQELEGDDDDPFDIPRKQAARCAEQLGPKRAFYTTLDSVRDINSIRQALGAPRAGIGGTSYGTYVSAVYAQQFPAQTDRIILDGVVPSGGPLPFSMDTFEAIPRVLREQCEGGNCAKVTPSPVGDLRGIVGRNPAQVEPALWTAIFNGDLNPALRGGQPAAFRSQIKGDDAPIERFLRLAGVSGEGEAVQTSGSGGQASGSEADELAQELRGFSTALFVATECTDGVTPWPQSMPPSPERNRLFSNALAAIPDHKYLPFGRPAVRGAAPASNCRRWPLTDSAPPPAHPPFPDVPTLIVNGTADVRTPTENAIDAARDFATDADVVLVEGYGHSLLGNVDCVGTAMEQFFADQPIGDPCADTDEWAEIQPLPPRSLRQVKPASGTRGKRGRTLAATEATVEDAYWFFQAKFNRGSGPAGSTSRGLRGGKFNYDFNFESRRTRLGLKRLSYVPGVQVSGKLRGEYRSRYTAGQLTGRIRVRGKKAARGKLEFKPNGNVVGRLNGKRVRYRAGK